jgi:hypothetical protein
MHLTAEELLDLAEGSRPASSAPHLADCVQCRHQLDELRDVMAAVTVDVPEPSPLFWDHLSDRVREAVVAEAAPRRTWSGLGRWPWGLAAAVSAAVVIIAVSISMRTPVSSRSTPVIVEAPAGDVVSAAATPTDDPSFSLLGDLAGDLDWEGAAEAGMIVEIGAADTAVTELTDGERSELQRLLQEAMSGAGAKQS